MKLTEMYVFSFCHNGLLKEFDDCSRVVVMDVGAPAGADVAGAVFGD